MQCDIHRKKGVSGRYALRSPAQGLSFSNWHTEGNLQGIQHLHTRNKPQKTSTTPCCHCIHASMLSYVLSDTMLPFNQTLEEALLSLRISHSPQMGLAASMGMARPKTLAWRYPRKPQAALWSIEYVLACSIGPHCVVGAFMQACPGNSSTSCLPFLHTGSSPASAEPVHTAT